MDGNIVYIQLMQYTAGASFMFLLWLCVYFLRNGSGNRLRQITGWVLHGSRIRAFTEPSLQIRESRAVGRKRNVSGKGILLSKGLPERCILRWLAKEE